ncbi:YciI family protein [Nonomuraea sp. CA-141351]|uniref:YciI family protein n=1 Tax=Nonomuraea sp. CA-141351 TaxID=3239996 RepID=UPI003D91EF03
MRRCRAVAASRDATSVRVVGCRTLMTDGPFADTKEVLGGFCLIEAAARIPAARLGGAVEVRPVVRR